MQMMRLYSRQDCKSDQSDCETEDGDGTTDVADDGQCHLVDLTKLCTNKNKQNDKLIEYIAIKYKHIIILFTSLLSNPPCYKPQMKPELWR